MAVRFRLELLGGCSLVNRETGEAYAFRSRKARCLLGLVSLWPGSNMGRDKLASFLWDPAPEELARSSLRQCLKELREVLGEDCSAILATDRLNVRVHRDAVDVDALALIDDIPAARRDRNAAYELSRLWKGELFGDTIPAAPVFEAWVQVERSRLRTVVSSLLTDHLQQMIQGNDFASPDIAEELVRIEPSHELAHQYLMRFHAIRGDQAGALRQYARLSKMLDDELDSEPSQESVDLLVAIKRGDIVNRPDPALADARRRLGPAAGLPKIAIRPPLSRYPDASKDYLSEGFANLMKVCLSKFRCWIILSWPSTGFDSKVKIDFPALGEAIGADYAIDTVLDWRQPQGQLFVSLVDCQDGSQVWSDVFDVSELDMQSMGSTVAGTIASKLASRINHIALLRFARSTPGAAAAYDLWLKGHQLSRSWSAEDDAQAQSLFTQAIDLDPGLACAYASLASVLITQGMIRPGYANDEHDLRRGFDLAQKALALDPFDSRNHFSLAWSWLLTNSGQRAESHFRLAVDLNPYDSETLIASAMGMAFLGNLDVARAWSQSAIQLNPLHPEYFQGYLAAIRYLDRDYRGALDSVARCLDVFPETRAWVAAAQAVLGHEGEAAEAFERFIGVMNAKWAGDGKPTWEEIQDWLVKAVPIVWQPGRDAFNAGLAKARRLCLMRAS